MLGVVGANPEGLVGWRWVLCGDGVPLHGEKICTRDGAFWLILCGIFVLRYQNGDLVDVEDVRLGCSNYAVRVIGLVKIFTALYCKQSGA